MPPFAVYLVLAAAAALEAGGDALIRLGLQAQGGVLRAAFFGGGAIVLLAYGLTVNAPGWDFGRLLGTYVSVFFIASQLIGLTVFHVRPSPGVWVGGAMIIAGGLVVSLWRA